jgi:hypothetical protein
LNKLSPGVMLRPSKHERKANKRLTGHRSPFESLRVTAFFNVSRQR